MSVKISSAATQLALLCYPCYNFLLELLQRSALILNKLQPGGYPSYENHRNLKRQANPSLGLELTVFQGKRDEIDEDAYDYIIKSPGIVAWDLSDKFTSMTDLFLSEFSGQVIGITGTKGKSTTSSLLYTVLSKCTDRPALLVGNIGLPALDYYGSITDDTIIVFEMSCHQLAHAAISPHIAVFLNLYEEHLDYYQTPEARRLSFRRKQCASAGH